MQSEITVRKSKKSTSLKSKPSMTSVLPCKKGNCLGFLGCKWSWKINTGEAFVWIFWPDRWVCALKWRGYPKIITEKSITDYFPQSFRIFPFCREQSQKMWHQCVDDDWFFSSWRRQVKDAGLEENIERLSEKYETKLGRKVHLDAYELSGGETQRLMLARALYRNAPVIVLDEPTAGIRSDRRERSLREISWIDKGFPLLFMCRTVLRPQDSVTALF